MAMKKVGLVIGSDLSDDRNIIGGVVNVASFLNQQLLNSGRYFPQLISLASSSHDQSSVRLLSPSTWNSTLQMAEGEWDGNSYLHVGAFLTEFEFQRYMPRKMLTDLLGQFDLIQVISGSPALAYVTKHVDIPVCLFAATMITLERKSMLRHSRWLRKIYSYTMLPLVSELDKRALRHVDHVFAETVYTKKAILPYINKEKITIETIGVDLKRFTPIEHRRDDFILCIGRLSDPRKNIKLLFEAYALLRKQLPTSPRLVLAGISQPLQSDWEYAGDLGIQENIEFLHALPLEELIKLYQNAAVFVLPSNEEGLGIVLLEAMACATPVVATRSGGPDSVVSDKVGFLTPVGDAQTLADRLMWLLKNPEQRRKMGLAGRHLIELRFSSDVVGEKYLKVYDRLLER